MSTATLYTILDSRIPHDGRPVSFKHLLAIIAANPRSFLAHVEEWQGGVYDSYGNTIAVAVTQKPTATVDYNAGKVTVEGACSYDEAWQAAGAATIVGSDPRVRDFVNLTRVGHTTWQARIVPTFCQSAA